MVVCDRYLASSIAYGEAQGVDAAWLTEIQRLLPQPSLTLLLDIPPEASLERKKAARDKFERDLPLLGRVRESYLRQAQQSDVDPHRRRAATRTRCGGRDQRRAVTTRAAVSARTSFTPAALQHARARLQRRAGRDDIVDQHDHAGNREPGSRDAGKRERVLHVLAAARSFGSSTCDAREDDALEQRHDRQAELPRQIVGLIEPALILAPRMQRHRHDDVGVARSSAPRSRISAPSGGAIDRRRSYFSAWMMSLSALRSDRRRTPSRRRDRPRSGARASRGARRMLAQQSRADRAVERMEQSAAGRPRTAARRAMRGRDRRGRCPGPARRPASAVYATSGNSVRVALPQSRSRP